MKTRTIAVLIPMCLLAVAGCSPARPGAVAPAESSTVKGGMGPYPAGLVVTLNRVSFSLESVEVADREPSVDTSTPAPSDRRVVRATFVFTGPGTNPAPGGSFFYPQVQVVADGSLVPDDALNLSTAFDTEIDPGISPRETLSFEVPADAKALLIRLIPSFADTQTVGFRIW